MRSTFTGRRSEHHIFRGAAYLGLASDEPDRLMEFDFARAFAIGDRSGRQEVKKADPGCEAFVGVIVQQPPKESRVTMQIGPSESVHQTRKKSGKALAAILERMLREFGLAEDEIHQVFGPGEPCRDQYSVHSTALRLATNRYACPKWHNRNSVHSVFERCPPKAPESLIRRSCAARARRSLKVTPLSLAGER